MFRLKASSWHIWRRFRRWRTQFTSSPCCITSALWWLRTSLRAQTSTLRLGPLHGPQRCDILNRVFKSIKQWNKDMQSSKMPSCELFLRHQVDFDQLQENLCQMERRCKASWDHLKVIAKHEMKPQLKQKMSDFLKDCAERIIILKIVHRRIINRWVADSTVAPPFETLFQHFPCSLCSSRFHSFLLYLGHPAYSVRDISVHRFSKILSEFALEYRTTRDRVLQQKQKRADHRERNKTRGKMIVDVNAPVSLTHSSAQRHTHFNLLSLSTAAVSTSVSSELVSDFNFLSFVVWWWRGQWGINVCCMCVCMTH